MFDRSSTTSPISNAEEGISNSGAIVGTGSSSNSPPADLVPGMSKKPSFNSSKKGKKNKRFRSPAEEERQARRVARLMAEARGGFNNNSAGMQNNGPMLLDPVLGEKLLPLAQVSHLLMHCMGTTLQSRTDQDLVRIRMEDAAMARGLGALAFDEFYRLFKCLVSTFQHAQSGSSSSSSRSHKKETDRGRDGGSGRSAGHHLRDGVPSDHHQGGPEGGEYVTATTPAGSTSTSRVGDENNRKMKKIVDITPTTTNGSSSLGPAARSKARRAGERRAREEEVAGFQYEFVPSDEERNFGAQFVLARNANRPGRARPSRSALRALERAKKLDGFPTLAFAGGVFGGELVVNSGGGGGGGEQREKSGAGGNAAGNVEIIQKASGGAEVLQKSGGAGFGENKNSTGE